MTSRPNISHVGFSRYANVMLCYVMKTLNPGEQNQLFGISLPG